MGFWRSLIVLAWPVEHVIITLLTALAFQSIDIPVPQAETTRRTPVAATLVCCVDVWEDGPVRHLGNSLLRSTN